MSYGNTIHEGMQSYKMKPFEWVSTGTDPFYFYQLKQYRLPYDYPRSFYKSYPFEHNAHWEPASGI
jgi:hypothetical protein